MNWASDVASLDLAGTAVAAPIAVAEIDAGDFTIALEQERILGVGIRAYEDGSLTMPEAAAESLQARHDLAMAQSMRAELMTRHVSVTLNDQGIRHRLLKGASLAHTVARDPNERSFRDVDVLVPSADVDAAVALFEKQGAKRLQRELRPGFDARFGKSVTLRHEDVEIDIHRLLAPGPFGVWMHPDDLFVLIDHVVIGGVSVPTLDRTDHVIHACYHVALGQVSPVLSNIRDIALLVEGDIDWDRFDQTVDRWQGTAVIQRAATLLRSRLDTDVPDHLDRYRSATVVADERTAIGPYLTEDPSGRFAALAQATLRTLPLSDRASYARAVGFPEGSDPVDRLKTIVDKVRPN